MIHTIFVISSAALNQIVVFQVVDGKVIRQESLGVDEKFTSIETKHRYPIVPIVNIKDKEFEVYISVRSTNSTQIPITLWEKNDFLIEDQTDLVLYSFYFGALAVLALYNLVLYFALKTRVFGFYVLWILAIGLMIAAFKGFGRQFLWGDWQWMNLTSVHLFVNLSCFFGLEFIREFLNIGKYKPAFYKYYVIAEYFIICSVLASLVVPLEYLAYSVVGVGIFTVTLGTFSGIYFAVKSHAEAKIYLVAWSFFLGGTFAFCLNKLGVLPTTLFTEDSIIVGSYIELILLSLAIGYRIKKENSENVELKNLMELERQRIGEIEKLHSELSNNLSVARSFQEESLPIQLCKNALQDFVMVWSPKDKVGGDYVWAHKAKGKIFLSLYDCTGHGVAAALRAMSVKAILDNLILSSKVHSAYSLINGLYLELRKAVQSDFSDDGLDVLLLEIDVSNWKIHYAGSKMTFYIVSKSNCDTYKGTARRVGTGFRTPSDIKSQSVTAEPGSFVYLISDGLRDQRGPEKHPFGAKGRVPKLLRDIHEHPGKIQENKLKKTIYAFKSGVPQDDDITLMGFRIPA